MSDTETSPSEHGQSQWLTLVGLDESGWAGLSEAAREAVQAAELLVGGERHLAHVPVVAGQQRLVWPSPIQQGIDVIGDWAGRRVCVLASGDPFWFGIGATLARHFPPQQMRTLPGPSAFSLAASRLGWSLQQVQCCSVVAREPQRLVSRLAPGRRLLVLSEDGASPAVVARMLCAAGFGASRLVVMESLGGPEERISEGLARDWGESSWGALNTLAVECRLDEPGGGLSRAPGRDEAAFFHDGQISKREIRAVVMALLAPRGGERLWDLGSGSGAVAVEWLLADAGNSATVVDRREDRLSHAADNAAHYGVGPLECVAGDIVEVVPQLAAPDAIFIGGGASGDGVLDQCWQALPVGGRLVATAVTTEGEAALLAAHARYGGQLTRLSVDRSEPLGGFSGWRALRPITLWSAVRPECEEKERT